MKEEECYSRQYTLPLVEGITGGPNCRHNDALSEQVANIRERAFQHVENSIARLEKRTGKKAVDRTYMDGFVASDTTGKPCIHVRVHFYLREQTMLRLVGNKNA